MSTLQGPRLGLEAFILDLDGVLTDTAEYHYQAWRQLADELGIPFSRKDNERLRGISRRRSLEILLEGRRPTFSEGEMQILMARKNKYYQALLQGIGEDDYLPGARELLDGLKKRGVKVAVGSASKNTRTVLAKLGILDEFAVIGDGHSVKHPKPAPDLFLWAAEKMNIPPHACVVVEDAAAGIEAALAAGMVAVGVGPPERVGRADLRYPSTAAIDLDEICSYLGKN
jgi:beta-phosphoglucomutase